MKNNTINKNIITARRLLEKYKGHIYAFGKGSIDTTGKYTREFGSDTILIISQSKWAKDLREKVKNSLEENGVRILRVVDTAAPDDPVEDVISLAGHIRNVSPSSITCVGGGSAIDCAKAANALAVLGSPGSEYEDIDKFFGTGNISQIAKNKKIRLFPLIAVQALSGSASHLTRYSNITFKDINQKKLIVDDALIPDRSVFDYHITITAPKDLTLDGAVDGLAHSLEAYYGADRNKLGESQYSLLEDICMTSVSMIVDALPGLSKDLEDLKLREVIGLATDLGGYAIMFGGTNGAHLNSYPLVDILSHGRACAILNPYYTLFFSGAINEKLVRLADIFKEYMDKGIDTKIFKAASKKPVELGGYVASAMVDFLKNIGLPYKLEQIKGFSDKHIENIIDSAKNPQLEMKLKNMPVALDPSLVEKYMRPVIMAAKTGDFSLIKPYEE